MDISSIDKTEIDKFKNLAKEWWKHDGKFKTLHKFNPIRLEYIINTIKDHYAIDQENELPLKGLSVLDIGCLLYTSPSPRDNRTSRMPSSA